MKIIPDIMRTIGITSVTSLRRPWKKGQTFTICIKDGMLSIRKGRNSKSPTFKDVWKALEELFCDLGMQIPEESPDELIREQTSHGAYYVGIGDQFIGRSPKDRFSMRGDKELSAELVLKLLYPLDAYLAEKGL